MKINTVTGPIDTSELGPTLMHEHVCTADWSLRMNFGSRFFDFDTVVDAAVTMFTTMNRTCGITTVVDGTPVNLGRDVRLIKEVAERTGLTFVVSSGFYHHEEPGLGLRSVEQLYDLLIDECRSGIDGTGILPGIMKTAVETGGVTPYVRKVLTAVGRVAAETGLPVFCHHNPHSENGGEILDIFESQGLAPNRVILGHSGDSENLDYLRQMLDRGCYIGMDRFGYCDISLSLDRRVATIAALCQQGYGPRMMLAHDLAVYLAMTESWEDFTRTTPDHRWPDFTFIHQQVRPALLAAGVSAADFDSMLADNPRAFFEGK